MSEELNKEKIKLFLDELNTLTIKYGIGIFGCRCCGSPSLRCIDIDLNYKTVYYIDETNDNLQYLFMPLDANDMIKLDIK